MIEFRENMTAALKSNGVENMKEPESTEGLISRPGSSSVSKLVCSMDIDDKKLCPSKEVWLSFVAAKNVCNEWRYLISNDVYAFYGCRCQVLAQIRK